MMGERAERVGAWAWVASIQFFIMQFVVQSACTTPFSLSANYISDLGNTECAPYPRGSDNFVCSPWHAAMNASFVATGITILLGAVLTRGAGRSSRRWTMGVVLVALAGCGFVLVGLFPENVNLSPHQFGAGLHFVLGNLAQMILGLVLLRPRGVRGLAVFSIASGAAGLIATALFVSGRFLGLGAGGMERLAAYPLPFWTILMGVIARSRAGASGGS